MLYIFTVKVVILISRYSPIHLKVERKTSNLSNQTINGNEPNYKATGISPT